MFITLLVALPGSSTGDHINEMLEGSAPAQLVHINLTVILVEVTAVTFTVTEHAGGPTEQ